eukprot:scaffold318_cov396-Prasinococcus_capsulatus_cf.AAC.4
MHFPGCRWSTRLIWALHAHDFIEIKWTQCLATEGPLVGSLTSVKVIVLRSHAGAGRPTKAWDAQETKRRSLGRGLAVIELSATFTLDRDFTGTRQIRRRLTRAVAAAGELVFTRPVPGGGRDFLDVEGVREIGCGICSIGDASNVASVGVGFVLLLTACSFAALLLRI